MGASESKQQIRKVLDCVDNDDVEGLKLFMDHPKFYQIRDAFGNSMLHRAIIKKRAAVFDFLLSLDDFPINARNYTGKTALEVALCNHPEWYPEYFIYSLFEKREKGDNIDSRGKRALKVASFIHHDEWFHRCIYALIEKCANNINCIHDKTTLLHHALNDNKVDVARCLIEKGADIKSCDRYGRKPLHTVHRVYPIKGDVNELLAMMRYFGADPSIPDNEDNQVIDYALADDCFSESMQEHLVFYFFDDFCTDYHIPLFTLFGVLQSDYSFAPLILKHININRFSCFGSFNDDFRQFDYYFKKLFTIKPKYLKFLLEKFDYVIEAILDASLKTKFLDWPPAKEMFIENFDLLLHSQFRSDLIEVIDKFRINILIEETL